MENNVEKLEKLLKSSGNIVFFGGAGVSTESGIKDFRSKDGLYNCISEYGYDYDSGSFFDDDYGYEDYGYEEEGYSDDWIYDSKEDIWYLYENDTLYLYD